MRPIPTLTLTHPSGSRAEVSLHGGQVISWIPAGGAEAIFLSRAAELRPGAAIRGGIPVVFPQFSSTGPLPKHGFARTHPLSAIGAPRDAAATDRVALRLSADPATRSLWPHEFELVLSVSIDDRALEVELEVRNPGSAEISFTAALHTYVRVADVRGASVEGLRRTRYRDAKADIGAPLAVDAADALPILGPVDRLYVDAPRRVRLLDPAGGRALAIATRGFRDLVVWNPWIDGAAALPDLADDEYLEMLCVEAAQVEHPVALPPGGRWAGAQRIEADEA